jgi:phosphohistidine phosphatase SixA
MTSSLLPPPRAAAAAVAKDKDNTSSSIMVTVVIRKSEEAAHVATTPTTTTTTDPTNWNCCWFDDDLPPLDTANKVRVLVCRHGETENNRLQLIKGARVDAPINERGQAQAVRLGQALSALLMLTTMADDNEPLLILHSPMIRARQTAQLAANAFATSKITPTAATLLPTTTTTTTTRRQTTRPCVCVCVCMCIYKNVRRQMCV